MPDTKEATEFEALLEPTLGRAYAVALRMTGNPDDAQDLVQETALRAFRAFNSFERGTYFKAWFLRILVNLHLNRARKSGREAPTVSIDEAPDLFLYQQAQNNKLMAKQGDPAAQLMSRFDRETIAQALLDLPEDFRLVATLYLIEDLSYEQIAHIADCPVGTVRSRLHRGRKLLQKSLWDLAKERGIVRE